MPHDQELELKYRNIPYRLKKSSLPDDNEGEIWFFEYRPDRRDPEWLPRGSLRRRDGVFHFNGQQFTSGHSVLMHRLTLGP